MTAADILLLLLGIGCFVAFGWVGRLFPRWGFWHYSDVIYYPLAGIGVALLFFSSDADRVVASLEQQRRNLQREWQRESNPRPQWDFKADFAESLDDYVRWIDEQKRTGESCRRRPGYACQTYADHAGAIDDVFDDFSPPKPDADAETQVRGEEHFCTLTYRLIDRLSDQVGLGSEAFEAVKRRVTSRPPASWSPQEAEGLKREILAARDLVLRISQGRHTDLIEEQYRAQEGFAGTLYAIASACAARSGDQAAKLEEMDRWRRTQSEHTRTDAQLLKAIEQARRDGTKTGLEHASKQVQLGLWPFVLLLA
ncbi:MAG TPA: hypothetical protein VEA60_13885, partial [Allosphingosinicella sp.]|nr:hypothetical protein [Allosphingosinicella sp.]